MAIRFRNAWQRLLAIAMGLGIGMLAAEVLLRVLGISYPVPYAPDAYCGTRLQPGFYGYWSKEGAEKFCVQQFG